MTKIMVVGDTHGDGYHAAHVLEEAKAQGISTILQVGDFGFLWRDPMVFSQLDRALESYGISMWWLDGNHENFELMESMGVTPDDETDTWMTPRIRYLPRGFRFEVDGVRFLAFGGATSIDRLSRSPHITWWPQEAIQVRQVTRVAAEPPVDIMVTHEVPFGVPSMETFLQGTAHHWRAGPLRDSLDSRRHMAEVVDRVKPKMLIHGHYHHRYSAFYGSVRIEGLNGSSSPANSWLVLDTDRMDEWL